MNIENKNTSGSVDLFAAELQAVMGTYPPTAEQVEEFKTRKAELASCTERARIEKRDRKMADLKQGAMKVMRGENYE